MGFAACATDDPEAVELAVEDAVELAVLDGV